MLSFKNKYLLYTLCILLLFIGCKKDEGTSWDADILAPLLKSSLGLSNLVPDSLIQTNPDNSLKIVYSGNVVTISLDTLASIPDTTLLETFYSPLGGFTMLPGQAIPLPNPQTETKFDLKKAELTYAKIKSGTLTFKLESNIEEATVLNFDLPTTTKDGIPLSIDEVLPAGTQNNPASVTETYDLSGYELDLRGPNQNDFNTFLSTFSAVINPLATDPVQISSGSYYTIEYSLDDIVTEYARGYFGEYEINTGLTTDTINVFNKITGGTFDLESIDLKLNIENGFGIDAELVIDTIMGTNSIIGNTTLLNHSSVGTATQITRALDAPSVGYPFTYSSHLIEMNSSNSNIEQLIENLPDKLSHSFRLKINPLGNASNGNDFLWYNSDLKVHLDLEHPVSFSANNLIFIDTVDFSAGIDEDKEIIINGNLFLYAKNGFPIETNVQIYLLNDLMNISDSLVTYPGTIQAAEINMSLGKADQQRLSTIAIPLNVNTIESIKNTKKAIVEIRFATIPGNQHLKIYSDYKVDISLVGDFSYRIKTN